MRFTRSLASLFCFALLIFAAKISSAQLDSTLYPVTGVKLKILDLVTTEVAVTVEELLSPSFSVEFTPGYIFSDYLNKGTYRFTVSLMPRYTGYYHLNPAKAEMMYFPVFFGREGMKKVAIRGK